jgi:hypothetical protein
MFERWVVCGSTYTTDDPTFLCERCFLNTHYVEDDNYKEIGSNSGREDEATTSSWCDLESLQKDNPRLKKTCDFKAYHFSQL